MDIKTANNFFDNVTWFNSFFNDVKIILDKISNLIEREQGYTSKWFYYYKPNDLPSIPNTYFLAMEGEGKLKLQIIAIFEKDYVKNNFIRIQEPSLIVIQHNYSKNNSQYIGGQFLDNPAALIELIHNGEFVEGGLEWDEVIKIRAFQVPLDMFSEYRDQTVREAIILKLANSL